MEEKSTLLEEDRKHSQKDNLFGKAAEMAFFSGKEVLPLRAPTCLLDKIQPDNRNFDYKLATFSPELLIGESYQVQTEKHLSRLALHMFRNNKYLSVFEANICWVGFTFLMRKFPDLIFKKQPVSNYVKSLYYYLPSYTSTAEIVLYSKIQKAAGNHIPDKVLPGFALLGMDVQLSQHLKIERPGVIAVPYYCNVPKIAHAL